MKEDLFFETIKFVKLYTQHVLFLADLGIYPVSEFHFNATRRSLMWLAK